ncbi:hypothetical protein NC651_016204 [Populus alba x Populus x berolinensis]|nr:hypothetical protein NC651_016204 [Populus alba x Populus x berolinensis]
MWIWLKISLLSNPCVTGIEHAYVHVHRNNTPAQKLYEKMGFEIVEAASSQLVEEQTYLLCCNYSWRLSSQKQSHVTTPLIASLL